MISQRIGRFKALEVNSNGSIAFAFVFFFNPVVARVHRQGAPQSNGCE